MAPEHEAQRAFYDHESDERHRRRRPAADWGVGEDIFDRMPSRRFKRADRRAGHQEIVIRRAETGTEAVWVDEGPANAAWADDAGEDANRAPAEAPRRAATGGEGRRTRRPVESWFDDEALPLVRGESRTIVLAPAEPEPEAQAPARR